MPAGMPSDSYKKNIVFSEQREWRVDDYHTPSSSDQMIINLSMKIEEVDSGSARLLCLTFLSFGQRQSLGFGVS